MPPPGFDQDLSLGQSIEDLPVQGDCQDFRVWAGGYLKGGARSIACVPKPAFSKPPCAIEHWGLAAQFHDLRLTLMSFE
jgi:hypothetical protein